MAPREFTGEEVVTIAESAGVHLARGERADAIAAIDRSFRVMFDSVDDFPESKLRMVPPPIAAYGESL